AFAASIAVFPLSDLLDFEHETWRFEAHYLDSLIGPLAEKHEAYVRRSVINRADQICKPVLLLHGDADDVVAVSQTIRLAERMTNADCTVVSHIYEGEGHGWKKPA